MFSKLLPWRWTMMMMSKKYIHCLCISSPSLRFRRSEVTDFFSVEIFHLKFFLEDLFFSRKTFFNSLKKFQHQCSWHQIHFQRKRKKFLLFFVNDNEVIKKVFDRENGSEFFNGMQAYLFARHIPMKWGFIGVFSGGHLARLQRFRVKFMLHDFYVGTFFDYIFFSFSWLFFFCIVISHVEFYYFNMMFSIWMKNIFFFSTSGEINLNV